MEIRILKYFLAVAREENITRAAEVLHITQPTLSRQLMQLEEELDTKLFVRGKNKLSLTEAGMLLRRRAEEMVELNDKTIKEFLQKENMITGEICFGGGETYAMHIVAQLMKEFQDKYPRVTYQFYSGHADDIKSRIDHGLVDIGLLTEPVDIEKYDYVRLDAHETWGIVARKDSPLADKGYVTPSDLVQLPIIISMRDNVQREILNWLDKDKEQLNIVSTFNLIYNAAIMVEEGLGYAISIEGLINTSADSSLCFIPLSPTLKTGSVIVWKKHQTFSPSTSEFIDLIKQKYKTL